MDNSVVVIVSAFFLIGITVGVIAVIALSVLRAPPQADPGDPGDLPGYGPRGTGRRPRDPGFQAPARRTSRTGPAKATAISAGNSPVRAAINQPRVPGRGRGAGWRRVGCASILQVTGLVLAGSAGQRLVPGCAVRCGSGLGPLAVFVRGPGDVVCRAVARPG